MKIEEVMAIQAKLNLGKDHVAYIGSDKWVVAHTDEEREEGFEAMCECPINDWFESWGAPPAPIGLYIPLADAWGDWELLPIVIDD